jgi:hypothetical protein
MNDKKMLQFIEWLGANVPELKGQSPEQIMTTINQLAETPEGQQMLEGLVQQFESSSTGMFRKGGKLDYLLCLKKGGNVKNCGCGKKIENRQEGGPVLQSNYNSTNLPTPASYVPAEEAAFSVVRGRYKPIVPTAPHMNSNPQPNGYISQPNRYAPQNGYVQSYPQRNGYTPPKLTGELRRSTNPYAQPQISPE